MARDLLRLVKLFRDYLAKIPRRSLQRPQSKGEGGGEYDVFGDSQEPF